MSWFESTTAVDAVVKLFPESIKVVASITASICAVMVTAGLVQNVRARFQQSCAVQRQQYALSSYLAEYRRETQRHYEVINAMTVTIAASTTMLLFLMNLGSQIATGTLLFTCTGIALCAISVVSLNYVLSRQSLEMEPKLTKTGLTLGA
jgi:uncharacterized ion transporter superfamily protein YfcC